MHCPYVVVDDLPQELLDEVERAEIKQNGQLLEEYLNEVLFADHRVICSRGMRDFFILAHEQMRRSQR